MHWINAGHSASDILKQILLKYIFIYFDYHFTEVILYGLIWEEASIGAENGLSSVWWQLCISVSTGLKELNALALEYKILN